MTKNLSDSRVVQTEAGTWLAHWCGVPGNTPPIEKRKWLCLACFETRNKPSHHIVSVRSIDWKEAARNIGPEAAERAYNIIKYGRPDVWERIKNVEELGLESEICCKDCKTILNPATEALVEVF